MQEEAICFRLVWQRPMAGAKQWVHVSARQCREGAAPACQYFSSAGNSHAHGAFHRQLQTLSCFLQRLLYELFSLRVACRYSWLRLRHLNATPQRRRPRVALPPLRPLLCKPNGFVLLFGLPQEFATGTHNRLQIKHRSDGGEGVRGCHPPPTRMHRMPQDAPPSLPLPTLTPAP